MSDSTESFTKKAMVVHHHHHHHHEVEPSSTVTAVSSAGMSGNGCSGREKTLTVCVILLAVFSFGLLAFVIVSWPLSALLAPAWNADLSLIGVCDTAECVEISYKALNAANFSANACNDFYHYACSRWQDANPIKSEQFFNAANINLIKDRVDLHIKKLLEVPNVEHTEDSSNSGSSNKSRRKSWKMEKNTKAFYHSCINFVDPDEDRLVWDLIKSVGGYHWSDTWLEGQFDLTRTTLKFLWLNAAPLFDVMLDIDAKNRSRFALIIDLPRPTSLIPSLFHSTTSQDHDYLFNLENSLNRQRVQEDRDPPVNFRYQNGNNNSNGSSSSSSSDGKPYVDRSALYKMITDNIEVKKMHQLRVLVRKVCSMMNVTEEECHADSNDIIMIVTQIQKLVPSQRTRKFWKQQNLVYNKYRMETLEAQFGGIDWKFLLGNLVLGTAPTGGNRRNDGASMLFDHDGVKWNEVLGTVYVPYPDYLRRLLTYIQFTNKRVLYNAMLMVYVRDMLNDLMDKQKSPVPPSSPSSPAPLPPPSTSLRESPSAPGPAKPPITTGNEPRWKFCVHATKSVFAMELSSLYLRSFDPLYLQRLRTDVERIFGNVKESLKSFLNRSTWLEKNTRMNAIRKIETLKGNFLAPSFYFREDYLDDSIKGIEIDPEDFVSNVRLVYKLFREQLYRLFRSRINEDRATWAFVTFPFVVNAFYIQQFNSIVIPLAFLSPPQYTWSAPKYINYATIALTIAHEALHALDGSGSDFDAQGKLQEWVSDSRGFLREKSACVAKQYSDNFRKLIPFYQTQVPAQVDGNLTQNENMADIAGLQVAFNAYLRYRSSLSKEELLVTELKLPGLNSSLEQVFFLSVAQAYCANISPMGYIFLLEMDEHTPHPERINGMLMNIPEFSRSFHCPLGSPMNPVQKCSLW